MKLKTKIQLFTTIWMLLIVVIVNISIYLLFDRLSVNAEVERLQSQSESITESLLSTEGNAAESEALLQAFLPTNGMIRIIGQEEVLSIQTTEDRFRQLPAEYSTGESQRTFQSESGERYAAVEKPIIWQDGSIVTLEVTEHMQALEENMTFLRIALLIATLFIIIPTVIGGRLLGNLLLRPILELIRTMKDIQQRGELKKLTLKGNSKDELYEMGDTFNHMMERLESNFEKQNQFVSDASHELKTPLSIIASYAGLLKRWGKEKPEVREEAVDAILSESERMKSITEQMLTLARDESMREIKKQTVDLAALAEEASHAFSKTYEREIIVKTAEEIEVVTDKEKLKQLLYILLDNALKYSEENVVIEVDGGKSASIKVIDFGEGLSKEEQAKIFDRFYRVDKARSRKTGGTGLGLSIAFRLSEVLGGKIEVESEPGAGASFIFRFPS